jgi:hypothetical protein
MNKARRADIAKAVELLNDAKGIIETCVSDEQEYYDNMPEALQGGEKGQAAESAASTLSEVESALDDAISNLEGIE